MLLEKSDKFFGTRRQNMPVWQNVQAELRNMTHGDNTPENGPSITFLAPVRLGGARGERHTESVLAFVAVVIGKLFFFSPPIHTFMFRKL